MRFALRIKRYEAINCRVGVAAAAENWRFNFCNTTICKEFPNDAVKFEARTHGVHGRKRHGKLPAGTSVESVLMPVDILGAHAHHIKTQHPLCVFWVRQQVIFDSFDKTLAFGITDGA